VLCSVVSIRKRPSAVRKSTYIIIIFPNLRQVLDYFNSNLRQVLLGAKARDEQDVWGSNGTAAKDDFTVGFNAILGRYWRFRYFNADRAGFRTRFIE
jgi:hypothetical protein